MSFKEKNIMVTLVNFSLILTILLVSVSQMILNDDFTSTNVFRLWGIVIVLAIIVTIAATIMTHIVIAIIHAIKTGEDAPKIEDLEDERDKLIDLRGTKITYTVYSLGSFFAMLTYALGESPLVMFTLLIIVGVTAQIIGDITRLMLYRGVF